MKTISITPVYDSRQNSEQAQSHNARNQQGEPLNELATCATSALVALQVLDSSMAPELSLGNVVVIDRTGRLTDGALVLVEAGEHLLIRQWQPMDKDCVKLVALNPLWNSIRFSKAEIQVKGVVVQRNGRRRSERKRYS